MRNLTELEVEQLASRLREAGIVHPELHADLLDHLCCLVEEMDADFPIETAFEHAFQVLCPEADLHHLQKERDLLINSNTIAMTQLKFSLGFLTAFMISMGVLFRMMHWPGGMQLLLLGHAALLGLSFTLLAQLIKNNKVRTAKSVALVTAGSLAGILIAIGGLFKLFHWPTANIQLLAGMLLLNLVFLPLLFIHLYQKARAQGIR